MSESLFLHIKNDILEIKRMGDEVAGWCHEQALSEDTECQLDLVLDEMVSNVIRHGIRDCGPHIIEVNLHRNGQELTMEIEDDGVPFNPLIDAPVPDTTKPVEERRIGGLGVYLVRQFMDSLVYERREGKNYLRMGKRLEETP
jgi:anti-sigma regulatory factor (Ser/Thr protein kinase)